MYIYRICTYLFYTMHYIWPSQGVDSTHHRKDGSTPSAINKELPIVASALDSSSTSSLNFNAQLANQYQKQRERHGMVPRSRAYDSDSDDASSDSLYGEEI